MTEYKATLRAWADVYGMSGPGSPLNQCLLELRDRIEALEAAQQQPEPIDEEENDRRLKACMAAIDAATPEQIRAAAGLPERSSLVESVEPSFTQLSQILDGLEHCFTRESKRSYLRTWIRDWANHKITRAAQRGADQEQEAER